MCSFFMWLSVSSRCGCGRRVALEDAAPAAGRPDAIAELLPALAVPIELRVDEFDPSRAVPFVMEGDVHPTRFRGVRLVLERPIEMPRERDSRRRRIDEHTAPVALGSVRASLEPAPSFVRFQDRRIGFHLADVVGTRPPRIEALGENLEGVSNRRVDDDGLSDAGLRAHLFFSLPFGLAARLPCSAAWVS